MAGRQGLEPRYADPESAVLPLDDLPRIPSGSITTVCAISAIVPNCVSDAIICAITLAFCAAFEAYFVLSKHGLTTSREPVWNQLVG
jgi:hypothetical protein